jgi:hypothetical protein
MGTAVAPAVPAAPAIPQVATPAPATDGDRSNWVPPHRIRETREAAIREATTQFQQREAALQAQVQAVQQQLQALVGVRQPSQQVAEQEAIKQQFASLYPGLATLEQKHKELLGILERAGDFEQSTSHYWQNYGRQSMDKLFSLASTANGGSPVTPEAKEQLHAAFSGWVQASPERVERYTNDPTIVDDFWKAFTASFIDPARRAAVTAPAARLGAPVPQDTPGVAPAQRPAPKAGDLDEMVARAWINYQQGVK